MRDPSATSPTDPPPLLSLLTDFGTADVYAGVCEGVILGIAPSARVVHLTHGIPAGDVALGARALAEAVAYLPVGVHVAIVDPGVGTARREVVLESGDGRRFVGPDNGVLVAAAERCGGIVAAHLIGPDAPVLPGGAATFHGRDVFSPVAAHLACGLAPAAVGAALDPAGLVRLAEPLAGVSTGRLAARCVHVDGFGNCALGARPAELDAAGFALGVELRVLGEDGREALAVRARTFGEVGAGDVALFVDSGGAAALAVNRGSAAERLGLVVGSAVVLELPC